MKAKLIDRSNYENQSFSVNYLDGPNFLDIWHYHPELELVLVLESTGTQFVGDSIEKFEAGDVLLIGKNLPHLLLNDDDYFLEVRIGRARAIVINFERFFLGRPFFSLPETKSINDLLNRSQLGIKFLGVTRAYVKERLLQLMTLDFQERLPEFIRILGRLANSTEYRLLCSPGFSNSLEAGAKGRMRMVYDYVMNNFNDDVNLKKAAEIVHMNATAFSRYFKKNHKKNFTRYVNEVRIGYACKLLLERNKNISEICYLSGFSTISNFNRQFKAIRGVSPKAYLKSYPFKT